MAFEKIFGVREKALDLECYRPFIDTVEHGDHVYYVTRSFQAGVMGLWWGQGERDEHPIFAGIKPKKVLCGVHIAEMHTEVLGWIIGPGLGHYRAKALSTRWQKRNYFVSVRSQPMRHANELGDYFRPIERSELMNHPLDLGKSLPYFEAVCLAIAVFEESVKAWEAEYVLMTQEIT